MKKLLALALVLCMMFTLFAACGKTEKVDGNTDDTKPSANVTDSGDDQNGEEEYEEITYAGFLYTSYPTGKGTVVQQVEDAINEITEREIGVHVNFTWTALGDYATQLMLDISNNTTIDIAHYWYRGNISTMYANGAAMDITDLLNEYAPETVELEGWILDMASFNDRIYGVPAYRQLNTNHYVIFRADKLDEVGMREKAENMTTWAEYEEILAAITATGTTYGIGTCAQVGSIMYPYVKLNEGVRFSDATLVETLADSLQLIGADSDGNVFNLLKDEGATDGMKMVADWADKGYVWPDSAFSTDMDKALLASGVFSSAIIGSEYGAQGVWQSATGTEIIAVKLWDVIMNGSAASSLGCFVPVSAAAPEAAVKFINLLYNSEELMNLITWGIEGVSYVVEDGVAKYPEGVDNTGSGYHLPDYMIGNQFLVTPWDGNPADFRELAHADMLGAPISIYAGFSADITGIETLYASLTTVVGEYRPTLTCGGYSDKLYEEYLDKLDSVGVDEYIALYQTQLDEFMA